MSNTIDKEIRSIVSEALAQTNIHIAMLSDKVSELEATLEKLEREHKWTRMIAQAPDA